MRTLMSILGALILLASFIPSLAQEEEQAPSEETIVEQISTATPAPTATAEPTTVPATLAPTETPVAAAAPTQRVAEERVIEVNLAHSQYGLTLTIQRIVFSEFETRIYVSARNGGSSEARCVPCGFVVLQGDRQFNEIARARRELPRLPLTLQRGATAESLYYFDRIEPVGTLRIIWDAPYVADFWREQRAFNWSVYLSG